MDYKYIEQLLEKYWDCQTSIEEEQILKYFFRQKVIPAHLLQYKAVFACLEKEQDLKLGDDFDERILAEIERPVVKARRLTLRSRFMPLFKAAAVMILLFTIGGVVKQSMGSDKADIVYVYDQYSNKANDPQVAYEGDSVKTLFKSEPMFRQDKDDE